MGRPDTLPKVLTEDEQARLLDQFNLRYQSPHRNYTLCKTMLDCGLRVSEATALMREHIDMKEMILFVREGKGAKDRKLWFNGTLFEALEEWLERRPESSYVFPTRDGNRLTRQYVWKMVKRTAEEAEIPEWEKVSPHTLRHTFATDLYRETKDLRLVQKMLGHANIQDTEVYTHLVDEDAEEAMKNFRCGARKESA